MRTLTILFFALLIVAKISIGMSAEESSSAPSWIVMEVFPFVSTEYEGKLYLSFP